jgi:hypothetical protein
MSDSPVTVVIAGEPVAKARRQQPEAQIQRAVFQHLRARAAPGVFAFHPANGGYRKPIEAKILQGLGVRAGVPDIIAIKDGRCYALELKSAGGKLSENQERVLIALRDADAMGTHAHGLDQALRILEGWGLLRGHAAIRPHNSNPVAGQGNARRELHLERRAKGIKDSERFSIQRQSVQ